MGIHNSWWDSTQNARGRARSTAESSFVESGMAGLVQAQELDASLKELWTLRETFFAAEPSQKRALVDKRARAIVSAAEGLGGAGSSAEERARASFVRGRALDAGEDYSKEAEEFLSRAAKLAPDFVAAWNALGHAFWKKRDLAGARDCFEAANERSANATSLRSLSQLARATAAPSGGGEPFERSVALAKEALRLDLGDGESWYVLGNAHVARYFHRGPTGRKTSDLTSAAKAYAAAEAKYAVANATTTDVDVEGVRGSWGNPDLFLNRGNLRRYLEDYDGAIADLERAEAMDPTLTPAREAVDDCSRWARRVEDLVKRKGGFKPKKRYELDAALQSNAGLKAPEGYEESTLAKLHRSDLGATAATAAAHFLASPNARKCLVLVVALELRRDGAVPPDALLALGRGKLETPCVALSVYDGDTAKLAPGSLVVVLDPVVIKVPSPDPGGPGYLAVHCTDATKLLVDGTPLPKVLRATSSSTTQ